MIELNRAITASREIRSVRESELQTAAISANEFIADLNKHRVAAAAADDALWVATAVLNAARAAHRTRANGIVSLSNAATAAKAAGTAFPEHRTLAETAQILCNRLASLQTEADTTRRAVDVIFTDVITAEQNQTVVTLALDEPEAEAARQQQTVADAKNALKQVKLQLEQNRSASKNAVAELTKRWSDDFTLASLKPLTPEQLCWSVLKVTGIYDAHRRTAETELKTSSPLTEAQQRDPEQTKRRRREIVQRTWNSLKSNASTFVRYYGAGAGQPQGEFFATADQALFAANGETILNWLAPGNNNLTQQMIDAQQPADAAEILYLTVLNRHPDAEEVTEVVRLLEQPDSKRTQVARDLVWGLLTSIEFRFNH